MSQDPRIEPVARSLWDHGKHPRQGGSDWVYMAPEDERRQAFMSYATAALAAADKAATITTYTGAQVNKAGWVCGACEPGDYTKCDDCQSACDDVAQFVNRLIGGTE